MVEGENRDSRSVAVANSLTHAWIIVGHRETLGNGSQSTLRRIIRAITLFIAILRDHQTRVCRPHQRNRPANSRRHFYQCPSMRDRTQSPRRRYAIGVRRRCPDIMPNDSCAKLTDITLEATVPYETQSNKAHGTLGKVAPLGTLPPQGLPMLQRRFRIRSKTD